MAENDDNESTSDLEKEFAALTAQMTSSSPEEGFDMTDDVALMNAIYYIWAHWIDFHIYILTPLIQPALPPKMILPGIDQKTKQPEFVYPIFDYGNRLSASVGAELPKGTRATGKMLKTVKKMIQLLLLKVKEVTGEDPGETEIQLAFDGHELSQRMAFKDCIMRPEHLVITNFEPAEWGERQLRTMEELARKGYLPGM